MFLDAWREEKFPPAISFAEQRESRCCARRGGQEAGGEEGVGKNAGPAIRTHTLTSPAYLIKAYLKLRTE